MTNNDDPHRDIVVPLRWCDVFTERATPDLFRHYLARLPRQWTLTMITGIGALLHNNPEWQTDPNIQASFVREFPLCQPWMRHVA